MIDTCPRICNTLSNDIFVDQSDQEGTISIIGEKVTKTILLVNNVLVLIYFAIVTWKKNRICLVISQQLNSDRVVVCKDKMLKVRATFSSTHLVLHLLLPVADFQPLIFCRWFQRLQSVYVKTRNRPKQTRCSINVT